MSELGDLNDRLKELLDEARARGLEDELVEAVHQMRSEREFPAGASEVKGRFGIVGSSEAMQVVFERIERIAPAHVSVVIHGETGTGKELVARALHEHGAAPTKPFFAVNCAAVSPNLLESELFGHKRGSFTGAVEDREGHFAAADGGTVFLDEIGDMPLDMQSKLLRVLQEGEVRPVGSNESKKVSVRVLAASHRDLIEMCARNEFREDLYYRLNVVTVELPPLRDRAGDITELVHYFSALLAEELAREVKVSDEALAALEGYSWPGNVRELENELRRAAVMTKGAIERADLRPELQVP
jgi:two-component system, NtrC family, response regulator HydG